MILGVTTCHWPVYVPDRFDALSSFAITAKYHEVHIIVFHQLFKLYFIQILKDLHKIHFHIP